MTYEEWNQEIIRHILAGCPRGATIFLMVDEPLLQRIGERHGLDAQDAAQSFCAAVRSRTVKPNGQEITLASCRDEDTEGLPLGVAFLALMVLSATKMGEEEKDEKDFFSHFRNLLRIQANFSGRPEGMCPGSNAEEPLWLAWKQYLQRQGYFSAARPGDGSYRYLRYPLSQALLRYTDRERLRAKFEQESWYHEHRDADLLMARLMAFRDTLTKPLADLMRATGQRYTAAASAVHDLHTEFVDARSGTTGGVSKKREMSAGLFRCPGGLGRSAVYAILPHMRASDLFGMGQTAEAVEVQIGESWEAIELDQEYTGYCLPVGEWSAQTIGQLLSKTNGAEFPLRNMPMVNHLKLSSRAFHILVSDPDNPRSGVYRSGRQVAPDIHFIFLGNKLKIEGMRRLRKAGKVDWQLEQPLGDSGWIELVDCMILDQDWTHLRDGDVELFNTLRPRQTVTLGLNGGLRLQGGAYLTGNVPTLTVYGTRLHTSVQISRLVDKGEINIWMGEARAREAMELPHDKMLLPGIYLLSVGDGDEQVQRPLPLTDWSSLQRCGAVEQNSTPEQQNNYELSLLSGSRPSGMNI